RRGRSRLRARCGTREDASLSAPQKRAPNRFWASRSWRAKAVGKCAEASAARCDTGECHENAYPFRVVASAHLSDSGVDRGWALEQAWLTVQGAKGTGPSLFEWRERAAAGPLPAVIFNGTLGEASERFLLSIVD